MNIVKLIRELSLIEGAEITIKIPLGNAESLTRKIPRNPIGTWKKGVKVDREPTSTPPEKVAPEVKEAAIQPLEVKPSYQPVNENDSPTVGDWIKFEVSGAEYEGKIVQLYEPDDIKVKCDNPLAPPIIPISWVTKKLH